MKIKIDDFVKNSFVLSIDEKRQYMLKQYFYDYGLNIKNIFQGFSDRSIVESFRGEKHDATILNGAYNCSLGHSSIIKMAKCLGLPFVCIFEDDAYPMACIKKTLSIYLEHIPDGADVISLGWSRIKGKIIPINNMYQKVDGEIHGSHSYIVFNKAYDRYLDFYTSHPRTPSDVMMFSFDNAVFYKTDISLFIQYNQERSNWGCVGYIYENENKQLHTSTPPPQFRDADPYIIQYEIDKGIIKNILRKHGLFTYKDVQNINKNIRMSNKVVLIGGANSVTAGKFGKYIDSQDLVIRVNTNYIPDHYRVHCGSKTDMIIASQWHIDNHIIHENTLKDISWYISNDEIRTMNFINKKFTTGFIALMICLSLFDHVEIFGFGLSGDYNYTNNTVDSFHLVDKVQHNCCHNFNYEHRIIDYFIQNNYIGKLVRGEESHQLLLN